jgi:hypothetical protein
MFHNHAQALTKRLMVNDEKSLGDIEIYPISESDLENSQ